MNQQKIGYFLRTLRSEKGITQEKLAEVLGVSNRSISRWENGVTMPDFDLVILIAKYYDVGIEEILNGERNSENMDKKMEETLVKVAEYQNDDKMVYSKRMNAVFIAALAAFIVYMTIDIQGLEEIPLYDNISSAMLGFVLGALIGGAIYTSKYISKIRAFKMRILKRNQ